MKKNLSTSVCLLALGIFFSLAALAQTTIPQSVLLKIVRAEDELRFDRDLQDLLKSPDAKIRVRAALAAGRIGNETAVVQLSDLLDKDADKDVRAMAAFALGEIESSKAADAILKVFEKKNEAAAVRARALEAAGKIAAANPKEEKSTALGETILDTLEAEQSIANRNREVVLLGLTAALRAKPDETDFIVGKFLTDKDASIRADALNTLVRLKSKNDNLKAQYRAMLLSDDDAVVRANAARALGSTEDALSLDLLVEAATTDDDQRVRVAAVRSLGLLKDKKAAAPLLERGKELLAVYKTSRVKFSIPSETNELLEIATTLGKLLESSDDRNAFIFLLQVSREISLQKQGSIDSASQTSEVSPYVMQALELDVAVAKISPGLYFRRVPMPSSFQQNWQKASIVAQALGELSRIDISSKGDAYGRDQASSYLENFVKTYKQNQTTEIVRAIPDVLRSFATFKTANLSEVLRENLKTDDVIVRATAAELLGEQPASKQNIDALETAFTQAVQNDKEMNDAQLAILSALVKLDKTQATESLKLALDATDFLVRRQAAQLIKQNDLTKDFPNLEAKVGTVKPYNPASKTKLGQILNTNADYVRAVSRKNGLTKAVLTTEKGSFTIDLLPEDAPLTVDNFIKLAKSDYFNGIAFHRVVPNFVVQGGDPRGDGNGGPGWQIRCEINMIPFERGIVGMALSGKDTGGSQWFVTHSPQPHLNGGYTVFGRVNESDMKIVDNIARGDKILSVKIIENVSRKGAGETPRKRK